jgi:hypothetical protein
MPVKPARSNKKLYAMYRMIQALGRAIKSSSSAEKDRASRWSAAWGMLAGIKNEGVRLRRSEIIKGYPYERRATPR